LELGILKDLDFEMFLPIDGYDNYFISNFGNVKNSKTNTKIYGSVEKLKKYKCFIKSNFKSRLREFVLKLSKTTS
jgi:hypothetical protein